MGIETNRLGFEPLQNIDATTLTGAYQFLFTVQNPLKVFKFYNSSADLVFFSTDQGITDHDWCPPGGTFIVDCQNNSHGFMSSPGTLSLAAGTDVWAKTTSADDRLVFGGYF